LSQLLYELGIWVGQQAQAVRLLQDGAREVFFDDMQL
jgi:hypothetical protein